MMAKKVRKLKPVTRVFFSKSENREEINTLRFHAVINRWTQFTESCLDAHMPKIVCIWLPSNVVLTSEMSCTLYRKKAVDAYLNSKIEPPALMLPPITFCPLFRIQM